MSVKAKNKKSDLLTPTELELMRILWHLEAATVHQVLEALPPERPLAYTSVSTMLRVLEQKGFVSAEKQGRGHRYRPKLDRRTYEGRSVRHLLDEVFEDAPLTLVSRLLETRQLSHDELDALKKLVDEGGTDAN
nr:BlaI/MecI/CopY family transcriptional regulator [Acanthopleuribacter pedis]